MVNEDREERFLLPMSTRRWCDEGRCVVFSLSRAVSKWNLASKSMNLSIYELLQRSRTSITHAKFNVCPPIGREEDTNSIACQYLPATTSTPPRVVQRFIELYLVCRWRSDFLSIFRIHSRYRSLISRLYGIHLYSCVGIREAPRYGYRNYRTSSIPSYDWKQVSAVDRYS